MEKENTSIRLKKLMQDRGMRQIDILNKTRPYCNEYDVKMNKSDISQYVSGKVEPNQDKLAVLGMALGVNEAWLMGFNVPMERKIFSADEAYGDFEIIQKYSMLCDYEKKIVIDLIDSLLNKGGR